MSELIVERDGPVTVATLNRPESLNALNGALTEALTDFWQHFDGDPGQRVAVLVGAGERAFCVGGDVKEISELGGLPATHQDPDVTKANRFTPRQAGIGKPTICAVNGLCAGGGLHFVADCDVVLAAEEAEFLDPHVTVGMVSSLEPVGLLARGVPLGAVMRLVLAGSGERLSARRAYELGMVTEVVPRPQLLETAVRLAHVIASNSPAAVAASRAAVWEALERPLGDALQHGWDLLRAHWRHPDFTEGPRAFAEKRPPRWSD